MNILNQGLIEDFSNNLKKDVDKKGQSLWDVGLWPFSVTSHPFKNMLTALVHALL